MTKAGMMVLQTGLAWPRGPALFICCYLWQLAVLRPLHGWCIWLWEASVQCSLLANQAPAGLRDWCHGNLSAFPSTVECLVLMGPGSWPLSSWGVLSPLLGRI